MVLPSNEDGRNRRHYTRLKKKKFGGKSLNSDENSKNANIQTNNVNIAVSTNIRTKQRRKQKQ